MVTRLQSARHPADALTLAGLGPDGLEGAGQVTLDTHVDSCWSLTNRQQWPTRHNVLNEGPQRLLQLLLGI